MHFPKIFLGFLLAGSPLYAIDFSTWCHEVGGYFIPPKQALNKNSTGECRCLEKIGGVHRLVSQPGDRCFTIEEDRFCKSPASYICQSDSADTQVRAMEAYREARARVRKSDKVRHYMIRWGEEKLKAVEEGRYDVLDTAERDVLLRLMNDELIKEYFQKNDREKRATELFERAKAVMLQTLLRRKGKFPTAADTLDQMINEIKKTQLAFGWTGHTEDGLIPHNAQAHTDHGKKSVYQLVDSAGVKKNTVVLGAAIQQIDYAPEDLYFTILHELGHFIDPRLFPVPKEKAESHPFAREIACLQRSDTVGARPDQIPEAFADNIANEAWIIEDNVMNAPKSVLNISANKSRFETTHPFNPKGTISAINVLNHPTKLVSKLQERSATFCGMYRYYERTCGLNRENNQDCHPIGMDRVNALLAAPVIKHALGCSDAYIKTIKDVESPVTSREITGYCGESLYDDAVQRLPPVDPPHRVIYPSMDEPRRSP